MVPVLVCRFRVLDRAPNFTENSSTPLVRACSRIFTPRPIPKYGYGGDHQKTMPCSLGKWYHITTPIFRATPLAVVEIQTFKRYGMYIGRAEISRISRSKAPLTSIQQNYHDQQAPSHTDWQHVPEIDKISCRFHAVYCQRKTV